MFKYKKMALCSVALLTMLTANTASADGFTSHHTVEEKPYSSFAKQLPAEEKLELRNYLEYTDVDREPCQNYRPAPTGFVYEDCALKRIMPKTQKIVVVTPKPDDMKVSKVLNEYEINFAFDSAAIEPAAGSTISQIANEIKQYNPREVTVEGYTDTSGPSAYNMKLSKQRADAVSMALSEQGVTNRIIEEKAKGEDNLAVETKDGVALRENRRVVVEFRK